jgi:hypothetical protein
MKYKKLRYTVIYHDDFDGIVAAGMFFCFLKKVYNASHDQIDLISINYDSLEYFKKEEFNDTRLIVLDFPFHPSSEWWIDHHTTSFVITRPQKLNSKWLWDKKAKSCPELLSLFFKKNHPEFWREAQNTFKNLIEYSSMIDSAGYASPAEVYDFKNNYIALNQLMINATVPNLKRDFLDSICSDSFERFIHSSCIRQHVDSLEQKFEEMILKKNDFIFYKNKIIIVNYLDKKLPFYRYIGYFVYPDADFTITLSLKSKLYHISVGVNPWKENRWIDIGILMEEYGGGGRENVGAIMVASYEEVKKIQNDVFIKLAALNSKEQNATVTPGSQRLFESP